METLWRLYHRLLGGVTSSTLQLTGVLGLALLLVGYYLSGAGAAPGTGPVAQAVFSKLQGVRRVTVSAPGVLLEQRSPQELRDVASVLPGVAEVVREMAAIAEVYLISQVEDDVGQVLVEGALEASRVVGSSHGQVQPHRCLFCSTNEGKVAITRQLEPELHIDAAATTVDDLRRFVPTIVHVNGGTAGPCASIAPNIVAAFSLQAFLGI